jgi:hypothetical protein
MTAALVMPREVLSLDVLRYNWPKKSAPLEIAIGRTGQGQGMTQKPAFTALTARVGTGEPQPLFADAPRPGVLGQIAAWTTQDERELVLLVSLAGGTSVDSPIFAFAVGQAGTVREINTGGAVSTYGGFEVIDLDNDHSFELVTARNLDGMAGGFSYHAVRTLTGDTYGPKPEQFKPYFQAELAFLDWVVDTREKIQADPEPYMGKGLYGFFYAAPYEKVMFGFDSIVEVPENPGAKQDRTEYNRLRREAYQRVVSYRDELRVWLGGGARPTIWKLPQ